MTDARRETIATTSAGLSGLVFGLGLLASGLADPAKVLAFLDVAGAWDPSLAVVMVGAIAVGTVAFRFALRRKQTLLGTPLHMPDRTKIDARLVLGAIAFGAGWGLSGICPGPALVALASAEWSVLPFLLAMLAGLAIGNVIESRAAAPSVTAVPDEAPAE